MGQLSGKPKCPSCGTLLDGFTVVDPGTTPRAGDFSICAYCMATLRFTQRGRVLTLVKATPDEKAMINRERPDIHRARAVVVQAARELGREMK